MINLKILTRCCQYCYFLFDFGWNGAPLSSHHKSSSSYFRAMAQDHLLCLASQSSERPYQSQHLWLVDALSRREDQCSPPITAKYSSSSSQLFTISNNGSSFSFASYLLHFCYESFPAFFVYLLLTFVNFHTIYKCFGKLRIRPWWACWGPKVSNRMPWCSCFFEPFGKGHNHFLRSLRRNQPTQTIFSGCRVVPRRHSLQIPYI